MKTRTPEELLDALIEANFQLAVQLMETVHTFIPYGWNDREIRHDNSLTSIVANVVAGAAYTGGTFQRMYQSLCLAHGLPCRAITAIRAGMEEFDPDNNECWLARHQVTEVDLLGPVPESLKGQQTCWVLMDPTWNVYYQDIDDDGRILAAFHLHLNATDEIPWPVKMVYGTRLGSINEPAYSRVNGEWRQVLSAEEVVEVWSRAERELFIPLYHHVFYHIGDECTGLSLSGDPMPLLHLGQPITEVLGKRVRLVVEESSQFDIHNKAYVPSSLRT